jgi:hypothetical protein
MPGGGPAWLKFLLAVFVASFTRAGRTTKGFVKLPLPVGFRVGQRVRITLGAAVSVTVNPADKGALRWCTSDATVAFTGPGPSSPLAGIGGMSASPAGSSKRGDYP